MFNFKLYLLKFFFMNFLIRQATKDDMNSVLDLIKELAVFENIAFQIDEREKNFDPSYASQKWAKVGVSRTSKSGIYDLCFSNKNIKDLGNKIGGKYESIIYCVYYMFLYNIFKAIFSSTLVFFLINAILYFIKKQFLFPTSVLLRG